MSERERVGELVVLVGRLERLLERSGLSELEVEHEGTTVVLRTPAAIAPAVPAAVTVPVPMPPQSVAASDAEEPAPARGAHAVTAPLTGVFYRSPSPGAEAYVREGGQVNAGQVIGLIEAMKLFNEIKSDLAGRVVKVVPESGALVKAKQPLIEVEPL
jgi:acetyl-CoA carboxylase biotin carboxyl carrier protein